MQNLDNLSIYLEHLFAALRQTVDDEVWVQYDGPPQHPERVAVSIGSPEIITSDSSGDGRLQQTLKIRLTIYVPNETPASALALAKMAHLLFSMLNDSSFLQSMLANIDAQHLAQKSVEASIDKPYQIHGYPFQARSTAMSYAIQYQQVVRYGALEQERYQLHSIVCQESQQEEIILYESDQNTP